MSTGRLRSYALGLLQAAPAPWAECVTPRLGMSDWSDAMTIARPSRASQLTVRPDLLHSNWKAERTLKPYRHLSMSRGRLAYAFHQTRLDHADIQDCGLLFNVGKVLW